MLGFYYFLPTGTFRRSTSRGLRRCRHLKDDETMNGIRYVTDEKGRKVAVQIDLKKYGGVLEDFWDGLISESRRKEKGIPLDKDQSGLRETRPAA